MTDADDLQLPPGAYLLWGDQVRPRRGRKPGLTLEQIVSEAIALADSGGLAALSMQRLAARLGKGTMSLYRYVATKDDLTAVMLDTAIGPPDPPDQECDSWRAGLTRWAHQSRRIFRSHPWTLQLVTMKRVMGPNETAHLEAALRAINELGLSPAQMMDTILLVNGFVRGATQPDLDSSPDDTDGVRPPDASLPQITDSASYREQFPIIAAITSAEPSAQDRGRVADDGFEFGLRCILDGVEAQLTMG